MRAEARAESRAEDILLILEQRGLDISEDVRSPKAEEVFEDA
ncbi:hypothetical protein ACWDN6_08010 [Streptomyces albogriseolus]